MKILEYDCFWLWKQFLLVFQFLFKCSKNIMTPWNRFFTHFYLFMSCFFYMGKNFAVYNVNSKLCIFESFQNLKNSSKTQIIFISICSICDYWKKLTFNSTHFSKINLKFAQNIFMASRCGFSGQLSSKFILIFIIAFDSRLMCFFCMTIFFESYLRQRSSF